jgi:CDP-diacylglycerol--serine O-phosphatidyltransferase
MTISTIPTWSGKKMGTRIPREQIIPISVGFVLCIAALVSFPFEILSIVTVAYLALIPLGWRRFRQLTAADAAAAAAARAAPEAGPSA